MTEAIADIEGICSSHDNRPERLIEILHDVQENAGVISNDAMRGIAEVLNISRAEVFGVASFYDDFSMEPKPRSLVKLCRAEACQAVGSEDLAAACDGGGVAHEAVYCLGNCALGPAAMVDGRLIGRADIEKLKSAVKAQASGGGE